MKWQFNRAKWHEDSEGLWISVLVPRSLRQKVVDFVRTLTGLHTADLKKYRPRRSLDANAYMWVLLDKMADKLNTTKDELYIEVLMRYGAFTHICAKPNAVERVMQEWRATRNLGEVTINGKPSIQLQCYFGSSAYDTAEMSKLLRGVVSECKGLDIETATPRELAVMEAEWGR